MFQLDPSTNRISHMSVEKTNSSKCKNYMGKVAICEQNYNWSCAKVSYYEGYVGKFI